MFQLFGKYKYFTKYKGLYGCIRPVFDFLLEFITVDCTIFDFVAVSVDGVDRKVEHFCYFARVVDAKTNERNDTQLGSKGFVGRLGYFFGPLPFLQPPSLLPVPRPAYATRGAGRCRRMALCPASRFLGVLTEWR